MVAPFLLALPVLWLLQEFLGFFVLHMFWFGGWSQSSTAFPPSSGLALPNQVHFFYPPTSQPLNPFLAPDCLLSGVGRLGRIPGTRALQSFSLGFALPSGCILSSKHRDRRSPLVGPDGL